MRTQLALTSPTTILRNGLRYLVPASLLLTLYLYFYPVVGTCSFPLPLSEHGAADTGLAAFYETARLYAQGLKPLQPATLNTSVTKSLAPFRLLVLADPQLEGNTCIPTAYLGYFPHIRSIFEDVTFRRPHASLRERVRHILHDLVDLLLEDVHHLFESLRKRIDIVGNDFYLAHQYRSLRWWNAPTHVTVLGDLLGSQWLDDDEFEGRAHRYWARVFRGGERVPDEAAQEPRSEHNLAGHLHMDPTKRDEVWSRRVINVAGNHDIGYAGDISPQRVARFERAFGKVNYELRFKLSLSELGPFFANHVYDASTNRDSDKLPPELRIVVLNDLNLDTPALAVPIQDETYAFVNKVIGTASAVESRGHFTLLLTHVPLYKPTGVCNDDPHFAFYDEGDEQYYYRRAEPTESDAEGGEKEDRQRDPDTNAGTLKEQNQLSHAASRGLFEGVFGMSSNAGAPGGGRGRPGLVLDGHDHEGCDVYHFVNQSTDADTKEWQTRRWRQAKKEGLVNDHKGQQDGLPGLREITVRSMMGAYGGNAGLLSMWFDPEAWEWRYEFATCPLGTQHLWWLVHALDLACVAGLLVYGVMAVWQLIRFDVDVQIMSRLSRVGKVGLGKFRVNGIANGGQVDQTVPELATAREGMRH